MALAGRSGCGKSTLAALLAGLYEPLQGSIRCGGQTLDVCAGSKPVALVSHEIQFFTRSIIDNMRLVAPRASLEEIVKACQMALADDFIERLPERHDKILGDFSAHLSAGEKQRLAIARAMLLNPPVLILDEATANLDPQAEALLLDNILTARTGKLTVLISHRPHILERVDWIIRIDQEHPGVSI